MRGMGKAWVWALLLFLAALAALALSNGLWLQGREERHELPQEKATLPAYNPLHFQPAIADASDVQCLACHQSVLEDRPRERSPAGIAAAAAKAPYQQVSTYQGEQDTFHRRHLVTDFARELMDLRCNTCHQGHDPRDEAPGTSATGASQREAAFTLRKSVNTQAVCLPCHGRFPGEIMGLPGPWPEHKGAYGNSCLSCHATIRTTRHQVNYLKSEAIEAAGAKDSEVCYGCHGGRAWYRLSYPYPRHPWPGMPEVVPDWARERPTSSEARFQSGSGTP